MWTLLSHTPHTDQKVGSTRTQPQVLGPLRHCTGGEGVNYLSTTSSTLIHLHHGQLMGSDSNLQIWDGPQSFTEVWLLHFGYTGVSLSLIQGSSGEGSQSGCKVFHRTEPMTWTNTVAELIEGGKELLVVQWLQFSKREPVVADPRLQFIQSRWFV